MRVILVSSVLALLAVACGGGPKHAAIDPSDTASLESGGSPAAASSDAPASSSASAGSDSSGPAGSSPLSSLSSSSPSSGSSGKDAPKDAPAPTAFHPAPGATGSIDGKPFAPKLAQVVGPIQGDGRLLLVL